MACQEAELICVLVHDGDLIDESSGTLHSVSARPDGCVHHGHTKRYAYHHTKAKTWPIVQRKTSMLILIKRVIE